MRNKLIIVFSFFALLPGCATSPPDKGFPLAGHKAFEVVPVSNETGQTFDFDVTSELASLIKLKLKEKEFDVTDTLDDAIIIKSSLTSYETKSARSQCTVEITFVDKMTRAVLGNIVTSRTLSVGGLSSVDLNSDQAILEVIANDIVFEIERRIAGERAGSP